jgi:hypothetical protein
MAISAQPMLAHHVRMATTTNAMTGPSALRRLALVAPSRRPLNRDDALRQVRSVRHHVQSRTERFAHLKRVYD